MSAVSGGNSLVGVGRAILKSSFYTIKKSEVLCGNTRCKITDCVEGNGQFESTGSCVSGRYQGGLDSYQLRFKLNSMGMLSNGLSVRFNVKGWAALRYVAIGYTSTKGFQHIKIANLKQDEWLDFSYGFHDLINKIQNRWNVTTEDLVQDVRVYVSGRPESSGGMIHVEAAAVWVEDIKAGLKAPALNAELVQAIVEYFLVCHPETQEQAQHFLQSGRCPMTSELMLDWASHHQRPEQIEQSGTFRYLWHACQPAMKLLVYAQVHKDISALCAARDIINNWLEGSFYQCDPDQKYAWYDHGVAERLLCFLLMQQLGMQHNFDFRFMEKLACAIARHTQLLENEAFYSCHQATRYHNHAWFQDVGLMAAAVAYGTTSYAVKLFARGQQRLQDQINHLIKREKGYAVFIENSSGYHEGIQRLIRFAAQLEELAEQTNIASGLLSELEAWSKVFTYPDGRLPAQGDTFRVANPGVIGLNNQAESTDSSVVLLPETGYFVYKGVNEKCSWFVGVVATNSSQTHKHQDDTSLVFWLDGIEWLIDPSFFSHAYAEELPAFYRSAAAHNMLSLPGREYSIEPKDGRVELKLIVSDELACQVSALNRSYQGFEIQRRVHCSINNDVPQIEVVDNCIVTSGSVISTEGAPEYQMLTFHLGDGVTVSELQDRSEVGALTYELAHPATRRKVNLQFLEVDPERSCEIAMVDVTSGLNFMQQIETIMLQVKCPVATLVRWKLYVV